MKIIESEGYKWIVREESLMGGDIYQDNIGPIGDKKITAKSK